ncbi:hypothetical protein Y032_0034g2928 [Ancylostoma ceylanicum]|uniref:Uncharacterized protein n=1 Tax=Ancylostoma ceylanicum TaxID=53326 RepID=A0A016UPA4_9BILA|nr:hypothetical protein Y032_0034g2928 [Ancylostoma ceylanicum]
MSVKSRGSRTLERSRVSDDVNAKICETILEAVKFVVAQDSRSWNCRCPQTRHPSQQSVTRPHLPVYGGQSRSCLPTRFSDEYGEQYGGRSQRELLINWSGSSIGNRWTTVQRCCCRKCRHSITSEHYAVP